MVCFSSVCKSQSVTRNCGKCSLSIHLLWMFCKWSFFKHYRVNPIYKGKDNSSDESGSHSRLPSPINIHPHLLYRVVWTRNALYWHLYDTGEGNLPTCSLLGEYCLYTMKKPEHLTQMMLQSWQPWARWRSVPIFHLLLFVFPKSPWRANQARG